MGLKYFKREEFECKCGCGQNEIKEALLELLDQVRDDCGFPLVVTSGYRCPDHDRFVGGKGNHVTGLAADIGVSHEQALRFVALAATYGFKRIGVKGRGLREGRFVHVDLIANKPSSLWTY